jgi:hypothetical protein
MNYLKKGLLIGMTALSLALPNNFSQAGGLDNLVKSAQNEPGYVPPPPMNAPPPPPSHIASAETYIPYPGPPAAPMARSEKKNPPNPPVLIKRVANDKSIDLYTPNAMNSLLKGMKQLMNVNYSSEVISLAELDTNPEKNPILFWSRHESFETTAAERDALRKYLINGGTLILNPGRGSGPAYRSAVKLAEAIFPESYVGPLSPDHPILHSYYDLEQAVVFAGSKGKIVEQPKISGVSIDCRVPIIIPQRGLDAGFANETRPGIDFIFAPEDAQRLGINIVSYSAAQRAWQKTLTSALQLVDQDKTLAGKMSLTQVIYDGEWKTRHKGLSILLHQFNQKTEIPVKFGLSERRLSDEKIFDSPVLYMTGHENFKLSEKEINNLRAYLSNGGLLIAQACCGRQAFDTAFQREIEKVLPGLTMAEIPASDPIYNMPNHITSVELTPALSVQMGNRTMTSPQLKRIVLKNRPVVIYSPRGIEGGWEMSQSPYALGYGNESSIRLGENILLSAITH